MKRDGLLPRMEARPWKDGKTVSYRYHPFEGKPIPLGTDLDAALRKVLDLNGRRDTYGTLGWLWEKFQEGRRWAKLAEGTRKDYETAWKQIKQCLGEGSPAAGFTAPRIARYVHIERANSPRRADIEKALLSGIFKHGIMLGVCTTNPTIGVESHGSEPSDVMPEDAVLRAFLAWLDGQSSQRQVLRLMVEYASLAGNRRVEFLDLTWPQVDRVNGEPVVGGDVRTKRAKQRGKRRGEVIELVKITPRLADVLRRARALNRDCLYVFPTRDNNAYTARGFASLWQRAVADALAEKVFRADQRFNFHALRRYFATTHKALRGQLPNLHADTRVTARVYDATTEERRTAL